MKNTIITEFVNFMALDNTTNEQLLSKADGFINGFLKKQDGYVDAELVKNAEGNARCFIIHYESMEKVKAIVEKMPACNQFAEFKTAIVPGSITVSFLQQVSNW